MRLSFYFLNVDHGSSVVICFENEGETHFGVIDSNGKRGVRPRALAKLIELGATRLSFVGLTHPHSDHFTGLSDILNHFGDAVETFVAFPVLEMLRNKARMDAYYSALLKARARADISSVKSTIEEMLRVLQWADDHKDRLIAPAGDMTEIALSGFPLVDIHTILPPASMKGSFMAMIDAGSVNVADHFVANDVSLAFQFKFAGKSVVLGGDGTRKNWERRRLRYETIKGAPILADAVNLPHHGSAIDCSENVLEQLFATNGAEFAGRYGISSGDGRKHPAPSVITWMADRGILPYCTNLIPLCGANATKLPREQGVEPQLGRWLNEVAIDSHITQVCQGDVILTIDDHGKIGVTTETGNACPFRNDLDDLFGPP